MLRVAADRFRADFDALARIGATPDGGVHRPALGASHLEAREWFLARAAAAGLETHVDAAGNHSALLRSGRPDAPRVLLGSHLDSVPDGGRFDGALGVVAALETLRVVQDAELELPVTLEAIDFTDEEGTLVGSLGSRALTGALAPEMLVAPRGGREALLDGLARAGLSEEGLLFAARDPAALVGFLELHIEQGPTLEQEGADVGVVTSISGTRSYRLSFSGVAAHSGGTPMNLRRDAGAGAAAFVLGVRDLAVSKRCRANVGGLELEPGGFSVVPALARLKLELRSHDPRGFDELESEALRLAQHIADEYEVGLEVERVGRWDPCELDVNVRAAIAGAVDELGLRSIELPSGAGHDAEALARVTPSGMVFVPSVGGVSHAPSELTHWDDCVNGANVLLNAALALAQRGE